MACNNAIRKSGAYRSHTPMNSFQDHPQSLKDDDFTVVRRNLETKSVSHVPTETIRLVWKLVYKQHFLERAMQVGDFCNSTVVP